MPLSIRPETPGDIAVIHALTREAFLTAEHTSHTEHYIVDALRDRAKLALSLVAEENGEIVGHIAVSPVSMSDGSEGWYGLGPVSVRPAWQGRGVGARLVGSALDALRERGAAGCVVLGDPRYYGRFGFKATSRVTLADVPPEYFQVLPFGEFLPVAEVRFDDAFEVGAR